MTPTYYIKIKKNVDNCEIIRSKILSLKQNEIVFKKYYYTTILFRKNK